MLFRTKKIALLKVMLACALTITPAVWFYHSVNSENNTVAGSSYIVQGQSVEDVTSLVLAAGGEIERNLPIINAVGAMRSNINLVSFLSLFGETWNYTYVIRLMKLNH